MLFDNSMLHSLMGFANLALENTGGLDDPESECPTSFSAIQQGGLTAEADLLGRRHCCPTYANLSENAV